MKRILCIVLCVILVSFAGCNDAQTTNIPAQTNFHYLTKEIAYHQENGFIQAENRNVDNTADDLTAVINTYLTGPENKELISPFPANTTVKGITHKNSIFSITLSDQFSELSGFELSVACACLTLTVLEFVDANLVQISAENMLLDGNRQISMNADSLVTFDYVNLDP